MKKILITGANSYIGMMFASYLADNFPSQYAVETMDMIDGSWREKCFAEYDAVYHVAGIAHIKETKENADLYYKVNRDLAIETAAKAKTDGVRQFVFMSSMSVYGKEEGEISSKTPPAPKSNYGRSKLQAEEGILALQSEEFRVAILRPPMIYGEGCKGNYQALVRFAQIMPVFPNYINKRSMLHVNGLCKVVEELIRNESAGLFLPQDEEFVCTCKMVQQIAASMGRKLPLWKCLNPAVSLLKLCTVKGKKAFGDLIYVREPLEQCR